MRLVQERNAHCLCRANEIQSDDTIVFPEFHLAFFTDFHNPSGIRLRVNRFVAKNRHKYYVNELSKAPVRKVVFNQNAYLTFKGFEFFRDYDIPYLRSDVVATICVSDDNFEHLSLRLSSNEAVSGTAIIREQRISSPGLKKTADRFHGE